ncbi:MAG: class I SAM-dependent methyltransferase [Acidobacteriota bacterium]
MVARDYLHLVGYLLPTVITGYGVVLPEHGICGVNELTVGFGSAVAGAALTYVAGVRSALRRRGCPPPRAGWRRPVWLARQAGRPRGLCGAALARIMVRETAGANAATVAIARVEPHERVVELGCGGGHAVALVAAELTTGTVVGFDVSAGMVRLARRRNRSAIARGVAHVAQGDARRIDLPDASVDCVLATHTVYFWPELDGVGREIVRVLRPGGRLVLGLADPEEMRSQFPESVYTLRAPAAIEMVLADAGLVEGGIETRVVDGHRLHWVMMRKAHAGP